MKKWAWLLPCWVWKYFFRQFRSERVLLDGRIRFLVRLDEDFALVYDPQRAIRSKSGFGVSGSRLDTSPARSLAPSKNRGVCHVQGLQSKSLRNFDFGIDAVLAHKVINGLHGQFDQSTSCRTR